VSGTGVAHGQRASGGEHTTGDPPGVSLRSVRRGTGAAPSTLVYVAVDLVAVAAASVVAHLLRFGLSLAEVRETDIPYVLVAAITVPAWLVVLALAGCYDRRILGIGSDEYHRVINAAVHFLAVVAVLHFAAGLVVARGFVGVLIPVALVLTVGARYWLRQWLYARRAAGEYLHRTLLVGTPATVVDVGKHILRTGWSGFRIVGACVDTDARELDVNGFPMRVLGGVDALEEAIAACRADSVALTDDSAGHDVADLAARVQAAGADLLMAPAIVDVAGPRMALRSVDGLHLAHVKEPTFTGPQRFAKEIVDRLASFLGLLALSPVIAVVAIAIKLDDRGPVFFRQVRSGRDGRPFKILKFRTMVVNAEQLLAEIGERNETDGLLFKMKEDPRITKVGRVLRKYSIDEVPQLWNVLRGEMSLVGPRPPLPSEVALYEAHVGRRLLVKPGLTGLWQVSGRSDLSWDETVRLDLYYVDHWTPIMDMVIVGKTFSAVFRGSGAY
jgi:exopolysaccharide biosynthesis polyprenyl glycosylphosphotransferase